MLSKKPRTSYRTKLLTDDRAKRFAARLRREPGCERVQIIEVPDAPIWYFRFAVAFNIRGRQPREVMVGPSMYWVLWDPSQIQSVAWALNLRNGELLEVSPSDCTCPGYRDRRSRGSCPHLVTLGPVIREGENGLERIITTVTE